MTCRFGGDFSSDTAQAFLNQLLQTPAGTITCQHAQIMNMHITGLMGISDFLIIDFTQPVIGSDCSGVIQNQSAYGIGDR